MFHFDTPQDEANFWGSGLLFAKERVKFLEQKLKEAKERVIADERLVARVEKETETKVSLSPEEVKKWTDYAWEKRKLEEKQKNQSDYELLFKRHSYVRFRHRIRFWKSRVVLLPTARHHFWWLAHNCVAHMGIGLFPTRATFWLHDYTSSKINFPDKPVNLSEIPSDQVLRELEAADELPSYD